MVPSVTNHINITETTGKLIYSGGPNGLGRIFVSVHNATTNPSTGIKHIENGYEVLINLSIKSRSAPDDQFVQPLTYRMHFETDGGTYHRATIFQTRLHILVFFLLETWTLLWKLAVVLGVHIGTHAREKCRCSILDSRHWRYHLTLAKTSG